MPRRRLRTPAPEYDPSAGQFRELSPYLQRQPGDLERLGRILDLARPPTGVNVNSPPSISLGQAGGWGAPVVQGLHWRKGKSKNDPRNALVWSVPVGLLAIILVIYELDRLAVELANWWPGSSLAAAGWDVVVAPATFFEWAAQHLNVQTISSSLASAASGVTSLPGSIAGAL